MANARLTEESRSSATPRLEWLLGICGLALLLAAICFLTYRGLTESDKPGAVVVRVTDVDEVGGAYVVRFHARNEGSKTLSQLHLNAHLSDGDEQVESAQALIDYLPGHSEQRGGVYLRHDPRRYRLRIEPAGYMEP